MYQSYMNQITLLTSNLIRNIHLIAHVLKVAVERFSVRCTYIKSIIPTDVGSPQSMRYAKISIR